MEDFRRREAGVARRSSASPPAADATACPGSYLLSASVQERAAASPAAVLSCAARAYRPATDPATCVYPKADLTWSEQQKIEFAAPGSLRNVIRIVTETGLRIYKELTPMMKKD